MLRNSTFLNLLLLLVVLSCALSVVTSQHRARKLYDELQKQKEMPLVNMFREQFLPH